MKKIFALLLAMLMVMSMAACGGAAETEEPDKETTADTVAEEPTEPAKVMESEGVKVDGFFVDTSYVDPDGTPLKMAYLFLSIDAKDKNMKMDSKYTEITIGSNSYKSDFYKNACVFMPSYYYSSFIEDIYVGTQAKLALTFKIPEGDLVAGKDITLSDNEIPLAGLKFSTDDLVSCASIQEIGEAVDADACAEVVEKWQLADEATTEKVRNALNGYYFEVLVSAGTSILRNELEFFAPDKFELRTSMGTNSGTYEVRNGYVFITYSSNNETIEIPYEFENGEIVMYCNEAFSIYE